MSLELLCAKHCFQHSCVLTQTSQQSYTYTITNPVLTAGKMRHSTVTQGHSSGHPARKWGARSISCNLCPVVQSSAAGQSSCLPYGVIAQKQRPALLFVNKLQHTFIIQKYLLNNLCMLGPGDTTEEDLNDSCPYRTGRRRGVGRRRKNKEEVGHP